MYVTYKNLSSDEILIMATSGPDMYFWLNMNRSFIHALMSTVDSIFYASILFCDSTVLHQFARIYNREHHIFIVVSLSLFLSEKKARF